MSYKKAMDKIINFNYKGFDDIKKKLKYYHEYNTINKQYIEYMVEKMKYRSKYHKDLYNKVLEIENLIKE